MVTVMEIVVHLSMAILICTVVGVAGDGDGTR